MVQLTSYEKETIIRFSEAKDEYAECFTYNTRLINRLRELSTQRPDDCKFISDNGNGGLTFSFPKKWVRINPPPKREYTKEQKAAMAERMRNMRQSSKCDF